MSDKDTVTIEWSGELIPVIDPDTGEVTYLMHQEGESLLMLLIRHLQEKEQ